MLVFGPLSSLFDVLTFVVMLQVFHAGPELFRTGWFVESLATQTFVIFAVRTRRVPFWEPAEPPLLLSVLAVAGVGAILPATPLAGALGFVALPAPFFAVLLVFLVLYLALDRGDEGAGSTGCSARRASAARSRAEARRRAPPTTDPARRAHAGPLLQGAAEGPDPAAVERSGGRRGEPVAADDVAVPAGAVLRSAAGWGSRRARSRTACRSPRPTRSCPAATRRSTRAGPPRR